MSKKSWNWRDYISPDVQAVQESLNGWHRELISIPAIIVPCVHLDQKIPMNAPGTLLATGYHSKDTQANVSIYLAKCWLEKIEVLTYSSKFFNRWGPARKIIFINWEDFGVIEIDLYLHLIKYIIYWLERGKTVQIGCQGGHGRTGTLIAGILAYNEKLSGKEAIIELRKRYCKKAIESQVQENLIQTCFKERKTNV